MKKIERLFVLIVMIALLVSSLPTALAAGHGFVDVSDGSWYAEAVQYVYDNGIMNGISPTAFSPDSAMTRAMLVTVLYRSAGQPTADHAAPFTDTSVNAYYADAVAWASANGIVNGYGDGRFGPDDPVNRAQIATIFWRYVDSPSIVSGPDFADESNIPAYASAAVDWARANNILNGMGNNRFAPIENATRAQVAAILYRYLTGAQLPQPSEPDAENKILVAYFSASGNTKAVAETIAAELGADLFELTPVEPYTADDLNWRAAGSRVNREHDDESLRDVPLTTTEVPDWDSYDTVFIGYPIWWAIAAWPVDGFVKANDFTGKTVIPFATSSSSGMGQSGSLLAEMAGTGDWQEGQRFSSGASSADVQSWVNGLGL